MCRDNSTVTQHDCVCFSAKFGHFDILSDNEVRQGLKKFSDWPTYPQLYVDGELVGGLDIIKVLIQMNYIQTLNTKILIISSFKCSFVGNGCQW